MPNICFGLFGIDIFYIAARNRVNTPIIKTKVSTVIAIVQVMDNSAVNHIEHPVLLDNIIAHEELARAATATAMIVSIR